jgi:NADPH2:quinone reductase
MKAFRFYEHGGPEVLRLEDVAIGEPQGGELRIRNTAVAVNFRDVLVRRGTHAVKAFPSGIGLESAGVVEAVGLASTILKSASAWWWPGPTAHAEARIIPAARAIVLPPATDERTAAAMMIRGATARFPEELIGQAGRNDRSMPPVASARSCATGKDLARL